MCVCGVRVERRARVVREACEHLAKIRPAPLRLVKVICVDWHEPVRGPQPLVCSCCLASALGGAREPR